jgi:hypothetical protein
LNHAAHRLGLRRGGGLDQLPALAVQGRAAGNRARTQVFTLAASMKMTVAAGGAALAGILATSGPHSVVWFVLGCDAVGVVAGAAILASAGRERRSAGHTERVNPAPAVD